MRRCRVEPTRFVKEALTDIRMWPSELCLGIILTVPFLRSMQSLPIRNCILQEVDKLEIGGPEPKFIELSHHAGLFRRHEQLLAGGRRPRLYPMGGFQTEFNKSRSTYTQLLTSSRKLANTHHESSWKIVQDAYNGRLHLLFSLVCFRLLGQRETEATELHGRIPQKRRDHHIDPLHS